VQIFQGGEHRKKLVAQAHRKESIPAERGNIFDSNYHISWTGADYLIWN